MRIKGILVVPTVVVTLLRSPAPAAELELSVTRGHMLEVKVVGRSAKPTLLTWRLGFGSYLEVEVRDGTGRQIAYKGAISKPSRPRLCDFRPLWAGYFFGADVDLTSRDTFGLVPESRYDVVVRYRNSDFQEWLSTSERQRLRREHGDAISFDESISAELKGVVIR